MKKLVSAIVILSILFVAPLTYQISSLVKWPVIFSVGVCFVLLITQPVMNFQESTRHKKSDKGTMLLILSISSLGQIISVLEWAYMNESIIHFNSINSIGMLLMLFGISFRVWSIQILGNAFSATVRIKSGQRLITNGLYSTIRHPSYTGAWILMVGDALVFQSYFGLLILGPVMLIVYLKRIDQEESVLNNEFGADYTAYCKTSWKMFPGF